MVDIVDKETRSRMMSGIRGSDTQPELAVRKVLHARGFRYRLHGKSLPGKPDLVFPKYNAVIFVHGCFWHMHQCHLFKWPSTRTEFWKEKISANHERDQKTIQALRQDGWRVLVIWECVLKGKFKMELSSLINEIEKWLLSDCPYRQIP